MLDPFAFSFYRPFMGMAPRTGLDLIKFGAQGLQKDFNMIITMGVVTGLLGTMTPLVHGSNLRHGYPGSGAPPTPSIHPGADLRGACNRPVSDHAQLCGDARGRENGLLDPIGSLGSFVKFAV